MDARTDGVNMECYSYCVCWGAAVCSVCAELEERDEGREIKWIVMIKEWDTQATHMTSLR